MIFQVLDRFKRQSGIRTTLVPGNGWPRRVLGRTAHQLLRIVEGAVENVRRHSYARSAEIRLEREGDDAVLTIQDDGRGLQSLPDGQGYGRPISRMNHRPTSCTLGTWIRHRSRTPARLTRSSCC